MANITLVDDDRNILTSVRIALEGLGHNVVEFHEGKTALEYLLHSKPDIAILDVKMPRMNGIELLRRLREKSDLPVIFLTSKDTETDEIFGLKMGADDYIRKPFSHRLLAERITMVLRRGKARKEKTKILKDKDEKIIEYSDLKLDVSRYRCNWQNKELILTVTEFIILQTLVANPGVVKSRNSLLDAAYDDENCSTDRTIDSHIKRLRKKFKAVDSKFNKIQTLYGIGYKFQSNEEANRL